MQTVRACFHAFLSAFSGYCRYSVAEKRREIGRGNSRQAARHMATHIGSTSSFFTYLILSTGLNADALGGEAGFLDERSPEFHFRKQIDFP